jgi:hypothetical protein
MAGRALVLVRDAERARPIYSGSVQERGGSPNHAVNKATAGVMDAFASDSHIGMVFFRSLYGGDQIVEAKCEACGTNIFYRTYRSDPSYGGVARWGWTG